MKNNNILPSPPAIIKEGVELVKGIFFDKNNRFYFSAKKSEGKYFADLDENIEVKYFKNEKCFIREGNNFLIHDSGKKRSNIFIHNCPVPIAKKLPTKTLAGKYGWFLVKVSENEYRWPKENEECNVFIYCLINPEGDDIYLNKIIYNGESGSKKTKYIWIEQSI